MGVPVLVIGPPGSGKTFSIKGFSPDEVGIFSVRKGTLPFRDGKNYKICKNANYGTIIKALSDPKLKRYVIDDSQYLMVNEFFIKANDTGYQKYTSIGKNFSDLLSFIAYQTPSDVIVYLLHHTQVDNAGTIKAKTVGQMIDSYLSLEGCVDVCLLAQTDGSNHYFITQSDGSNTAKSPQDMFELKIPNDLKIVDSAIRDYYGWEDGE